MEKRGRMSINNIGPNGGNISGQMRVTVNGQIIDLNNNNDTNENRDKGPEKCPRCGNIRSGLSSICSTCEYTFDADALKDSMEELRKMIIDLKNFKKGTADDYASLLSNIDSQLETINIHYGNSAEVKGMLEKYANEKATIAKEYKSKKLRSRIISNVFLVCSILGVTIYFMQRPARVPTIPEKIEQYITEGNIGKAKSLLPKVTDELKKTGLKNTIYKMEVDSLTEAKNYGEALRIAYLLPDINDQFERSETITDLYVNQLIKDKEFSTAREKTDILGNIYLRDKLTRMIDLAEKEEKAKNDKNKTGGKTGKNAKKKV